MRARPHATLLIATLAFLMVLSVLAVPALAASSSPATRTYVSQPLESTTNRFGAAVNWSQDVSVSDRNLSRNDDGWWTLNVTNGGFGYHSVALLRFPLDRWLNTEDHHPLPANVTVKRATLRLYYACLGYNGGCSLNPPPQHTLNLLAIDRSWNEPTVRWNDTLRSGFYGSLVASSPASQAVSSNGYREWNVTAYYQRLLDPGALHQRDLGLAVVDQDTNPCTASCVSTFYSSNATYSTGAPYAYCFGGYCQPRLTLVVDPNAPRVDTITIPGVPTNATSRRLEVAPTWPVNLTLNITDPVGHLRSAVVNLTSASGTLQWTDDLLANDTAAKGSVNGGLGTRYTFTRSAPLDVPPGLYTVNLRLVDNDGNYVNTTYGHPQIEVENRAPVILRSAVQPTNLAEGGTLQLAVNVSDTWALPIHGVRARVHAPGGTNTTIFLDPPLHATPYGNGTWTKALTFQTPGTYDVTFYVHDATGNGNFTAPVVVTVQDTQPPVVTGLTISGAPAASARGPIQEAGGNLTFTTSVTDDNVQAPTVTLRLLDGAGVAHEYPMAPGAGSAWVSTVTFGPGFTPGNCLATLKVQDAAGNVATNTPSQAFEVQAASPPVLVTKGPIRWGNTTPTLTATVQDINLDNASLQMAIAVDGGPFQNLTFDTTESGGQAHLSAPAGPFYVGDNVTVRVHAADTLGQALDTSWTFAVDPYPPSISVQVQQPQRLTPAATEISRTTPVIIQAQDARSGLAAIQARLVPKGASDAPLPWQDVVTTWNVTALTGFAGDGAYTLEVRGVDDVGNAGTPQILPVLVDDTPPTVTVDRRGSVVHLTASDAGTGVASVTLMYRNGTGAFQPVALRNLGGSGSQAIYEGDLPFTPRGTTAELQVVATDALGNQRTVGGAGGGSLRWVEPDHPPVLTIQRPAAGQNLTGLATLQWSVKDPDGDPVQVTVEDRAVVLDRWSQVATAANGVTHVTWDTTHGAPDGVYVLRFLANDGQDASEANVTVTVANTALGLANVSVPKGTLPGGASVPVHVTILRPVKSATAVLYRVEGGTPHAVANLTLLDDGTHGDRTAGDHVYTAVFHPGRDGTYTVGLDILYGDDSHLSRTSVASFAVASSFTDTLQQNLALVVVGGLLVAGLVAVVVVQLVRYGYLFPKE